MRFTGDSAAVVVQACLAGLGVLRVPRLAVTALLGRGELVPILPDWQLRRADAPRGYAVACQRPRRFFSRAAPVAARASAPTVQVRRPVTAATPSLVRWL